MAFPGANGKIVFASDRFTGTGVDNPTGDYEIFTMNPNGTGITQLTNNTAFDNNPSFSADGRWVVFRSDRDGNAEIYVMNALDGSSQKRLTRKAAPDSEPAWSANGKKVAFTSYRDGEDEEIHTMKARPEGSKNRPKNLTKNDVTDYVPDWQPLAN